LRFGERIGEPLGDGILLGLWGARGVVYVWKSLKDDE